MRSLLTFIPCLLCLQSPVFAACFDTLSRPSASNYQPIPICPVTEIHNCFAAPPLVLIFDFIPSPVNALPASSLTPSQLSARLRDLVQRNIDNNTILKYVCRALPLKPFDLHDCFSSSDSRTPLYSSLPFFASGLLFPSRSKFPYYHKYRPASLPGYFAEYNCHPQKQDQIQLRQYHWGPTQKEYIKDEVPVISNYSGTSTLVLKISTFSTSSFLQKKSRKTMGFSIDPSAPQILYQNLVPDRLR